ncbi:uncharacterized protein LOC107270541 isoform X2 [Cephus cinctus]|uniref:Uncharacterized protein LOC107270541 isoform X2 n=1 Tax=Cephus cinctus TaxID=211228 RepID=A0AAJ7FNY0_CEPCN|nr:uncharacterized protein LOC107270541 isoform X2 [Cephus cinctus]
MLFVKIEDNGKYDSLTSKSKWIIRIMSKMLAFLQNVEGNDSRSENTAKICGTSLKANADPVQNPCPLDVKPKDFICSVCGDCFAGEKQFYGHLQAHTGEIHWKCTQCPESNAGFDSLSRLKIHENACHNIVRPFKCKHCDLLFDRGSQRDYHMRSVHFGEKSQICQICGKGFFRRNDLRTHLNIHLGTNLCICEICGRKFNHVSNLIRHCRIHAGVKPYPCCICGKRFTQIGSLARHKRIHSREQDSIKACSIKNQDNAPFDLNNEVSNKHDLQGVEPSQHKPSKRQHYCKICGESFQFILLLRQHEKHHLHSAEDLECKSCGKKVEEVKEHCCRPLSSCDVKVTEKIVKKFSKFIRKTEHFNDPADDSHGAETILIQLQDERIENTATSNISMNEIKEQPIQGQPMIYSATNQVTNFNSEEAEEIPNEILQEHLMELAGKINTISMAPDRDASINISDILETYNCEDAEFGTDNDMKSKPYEIQNIGVQSDNNFSRENNIIYIQTLGKDGFAILTDHEGIMRNVSLDIVQEANNTNYQPNIENYHSDTSEVQISKSTEVPSVTTQLSYVLKSFDEKLINQNSNSNGYCAIDSIPKLMMSQEKLDCNPLNTETTTKIDHYHNLKEKNQFNMENCYSNTLKNCQLRILELQDNSDMTLAHGNHECANAEPHYLSSCDDDAVSQPFIPNTGAMESTKIDEQVQNLVNFENIVLNRTDPTLRLVQTETGEQFYELILNDLTDKIPNSPNIQSLPEPDKTDDMSTSCDISNNIETMSNDTSKQPSLRLVQMENGQQFFEIVRNDSLELENFTSPLHEPETLQANNPENPNEININLQPDNFIETNNLKHNENNQYLFVNESQKVNSINTLTNDTVTVQHSNLEFVKSDAQSDFQSNDQINFTDFTKTHFDNSAEHFLELVRNVDNGQTTVPEQTDRPMPIVRLIQNEDGEQFFELIHDSLQFDKNRHLELQNERMDRNSSANVQGTNTLNNPDCNKSNFLICFRNNLEFRPVMNIDPNTTKELTGDGNDKSNTINFYIDFNPNNTAVTGNIIKEQKQKSKSSVKKFQCSECNKSFSSSYNFKQHIGTHFTDQQKFQCKECGTQFAWKSTLNKHMALYHRPDGPQKFVCEICPKVYNTLSQVNEHVKRDHLKERKHVCHCGKSFFKKFDLKTHGRTHTKERPYVCRACGKGFHHQSHIIRHERIHSGERPYSCNICQKTFTQLGSLKAHKQRHREIQIDLLDYRLDEDDPLALNVL